MIKIQHDMLLMICV